MVGRPEILRLLTIAVLALLVAHAPAAASVSVGQVISDQASIDGVSVPSGSTLFTESLVTTRDQPVAVRLSSGRVVGLAENSSARFETGRSGISVAVVAGTVGYQETDGELVLLAEGNSAVLDQIEEGTEIGTGKPTEDEQIGHVWEGEPVDEDEEIALCHLKDRQQSPENIVLCTTDPDDLDPDQRDEWRRICDWERIKVKWEYVPEHLSHADVFADKDMRSDEMPDEIECGKKAAYWWLTSLLLLPAFEDGERPPPPALSPFVP